MRLTGRTIILDNEPVLALLRPQHPKHRAVMAHLAGIVVRRHAGANVVAIVPTAVRAEAGWDRRDPRSAAANRLRIGDLTLDGPATDLAADVVARTEVSVADAHVSVAAIAAPADQDVVVLTSDPADIRRASAPRHITIVAV